MKKVFLPILVFFLVISLGHSAESQVKRKAQQRESTKPIKVTYATIPFDLTVDKLPPNFMGQDIVSLYRKLEKSVGKKSEFESTAQYISRIDSAITDNLFAFKVETHVVLAAFDFQYDADKRMLSLYMLSDGLIKESNIRIPKGYNKAIALKVKDAVNLTSSSAEQYNILSSYNRGGDDLGGWQKILIELPLSPERAQVAKPNLATLLVCKLKRFELTPLLTIEALHIGNNISIWSRYISTELFEIWIYDTTTGEVLKKEKMT